VQREAIWVLGVIAAILAAELVAGRHRGIYSRNDYVVNGLCFLSGQAIRPVVAFPVGAAIGVLLPSWKGALGGVPFWPALLSVLLVGEFANYWIHRFAHRWKGKPYGDWLWRLHRTHHTATYINVLLNFRISLFWAFVSPLTWVSAVAVYLGLGHAAAIGILIFSLWGIATHSHFRWDDPIRRHAVFGPFFRALEHVIVSPGVHHSHHGYGRDGGNYRNFGIFLSIYDWLFGTLHIPQGRPSRYGIPDPTPHWAEEVFYPLYRRKT
jgi:sterol desaturase/sphingolipid hydroxylase (fatty acid hydroxylase superfamily)